MEAYKTNQCLKWSPPKRIEFKKKKKKLFKAFYFTQTLRPFNYLYNVLNLYFVSDIVLGNRNSEIKQWPLEMNKLEHHVGSLNDLNSILNWLFCLLFTILKIPVGSGIWRLLWILKIDFSAKINQLPVATAHKVSSFTSSVHLVLTTHNPELFLNDRLSLQLAAHLNYFIFLGCVCNSH